MSKRATKKGLGVDDEGRGLYVYCVGESAALAPLFDAGLPEAIEEGTGLEAVEAAGLSAVVSEVPLDTYGEGALSERLSLEETARLAARLEALRVPMRRLVVNNVLPEEAARACDFCAARRRSQAPVVREFGKRLPGVELFLAPERPGEVRGRESLLERPLCPRGSRPRDGRDAIVANTRRDRGGLGLVVVGVVVC